MKAKYVASYLLATKFILNELNVDSAIIYTDNCAAIIASTLVKPLSGHHLLDTFYKAISTIKQRNPVLISK